MNISNLKSNELLALHAQIAVELRNRGIGKTSNNPTGELAEHLFCNAFSWTPCKNSQANIDAVDQDGYSYQIKGRRIPASNTSRQLGAIRNLKQAKFDFLAGVLFNEDYSVLRAAIIPHEIVVQKSSYTEHTNSYRFFLRNSIWKIEGVREVTAELSSVELSNVWLIKSTQEMNQLK